MRGCTVVILASGKKCIALWGICQQKVVYYIYHRLHWKDVQHDSEYSKDVHQRGEALWLTAETWLAVGQAFVSTLWLLSHNHETVAQNGFKSTKWPPPLESETFYSSSQGAIFRHHFTLVVPLRYGKEVDNPFLSWNMLLYSHSQHFLLTVKTGMLTRKKIHQTWKVPNKRRQTWKIQPKPRWRSNATWRLVLAVDGEYLSVWCNDPTGRGRTGLVSGCSGWGAAGPTSHSFSSNSHFFRRFGFLRRGEWRHWTELSVQRTGPGVTDRYGKLNAPLTESSYNFKCASGLWIRLWGKVSGGICSKKKS